MKQYVMPVSDSSSTPNELKRKASKNETDTEPVLPKRSRRDDKTAKKTKEIVSRSKSIEAAEAISDVSEATETPNESENAEQNEETASADLNEASQSGSQPSK